MKIGVFDSGIGGLHILHACVKAVDATFFYYGDNENAPYGTKSEREIMELTRQAFDLFEKIGVQVAIIACNTVTAVCIDRLRREYPFYIIGTEPALSLARGNCLLLATRATLSAKRISMLIERFPALKVTKFAPDGLVEDIERNIDSLSAVNLSFLDDRKEDCTVLGCTHFCWVKDRIERKIPVFDGTEGVARRLLAYCKDKESVFSQKPGKVNHRFFSSGAENRFFVKTVEKSTIFFLGSGFLRNSTVYEQMFVM
ncbi:MAG: aspartate/glutamate racemase family protein [Clostridia bacterium]|nr:aspartate/glutamate racemase family protein [Clostridia bacterium]